MPKFDPVRDAVLNSPIAGHQLVLPFRNETSSNRETQQALPSPTLGRRATDLSSLLNGPSPQPTSSLARILEPTAGPSRIPAPPTPPPMSSIPYNPKNRISKPDSIMIPLSLDELEHFRNYRGQGTAALSKKRKRADSPPFEQPPAKRLADDVAAKFYNSRAEVGVTKRLDSPIIGLKAFNNWVKSVLITRFAHPALAASPSTNVYGGSGRGRANRKGKVLDMGCGKGGDLTKWSKAHAREVLGVDIAETSVKQARTRWETTRGGTPFDATFAALDCFIDPLTKAFPPAKLATPFDVVSMQFCMHYAFENVTKARCMLENVSRWLRPGGVFLGTIPNADQLLSQLDDLPPNQDKDDLSIGNSVYKIRFEERDKKPMFGHKYWFFLQDAVDNVPEYIVRWENFVQMAAEHKLHVIYKEEFHQLFEEHSDLPEFASLLQKMKVVDANGESSMDEEQWEAANIYIAFAFEKRA